MTESIDDHTKILFPSKTIKFGEGDQDAVTMNPLPMGKLPDAIDTFASILEELYSSGITGEEDFNPAVIATAGRKVFKGIIDLLPYCIDRNLDDIPATATPEMIHTFIKQNIMDASKNWYALFADLGLTGIFQSVSTRLDSIKVSGEQS